MNRGVLDDIRERLVRWLGLRLVLVAAGGAGVVALAVILADAALDLSAGARVAAMGLLAVGGVVCAVAGVMRLRRMSAPRVARLFELRDGSLGNRLTNAVELEARAGSTAVEECLRLEAVALGRRAVSGVDVWPVARRPVLIAAGAAGAAAVLWVLAVLVAGEMMRAVLPRFFDPLGDHPPYSRLRIEVTPGPVEVLYGGQVEIRAAASGRPVDKLWLVAESGEGSSRAAMFLAPDKSFFQTLANVREPGEYYVTDGRARSRRHPVSVRFTPEITLVELTATLPEYTGRPARTMKLGSEAERFPEGTRVRFRVASNRPLGSGTIGLTPSLGGKRVQVRMAPGGEENMVAGEFVLEEPVVVELSVRDRDGLESAERRQGRFNILPDAKPRLFVHEPGRDAVATPSIPVPIRVSAQDDYGVAQIIWLRSHNHSIERPVEMRIELKGGPRVAESEGVFDLGKLGVRPGDVIDYYFEAADNYPAGPNLALSRMYRLEVISEEAYERILRQAAARKALFEPYFKLGAWLRRLAERARHLEEKGASGVEGSEALMAEARELLEQLDRYNSELGALLGQAMLFDIEQAFRDALVTMHTGTTEAARQFRGSIGGGGMDEEALGRLSRELAAMSALESEAIGEPARQIAAVARLLARADRFVKLAREQAAVARLLRRFDERRDELTRIEQIELRELAHQQRRVQEELRQWVETLPDYVDALPGEAVYDPLRTQVREFLEAVREAGIDAQMAEAVAALDGLDGAGGHVHAQASAERMDRLISRCEGLVGTGEQCLRFQPSMQAGLGDSLRQILAAMGAGDQGQGADGYSMFNEAVGLYGPDAEIAREPAAGGGEIGGGGGRPVVGAMDEPDTDWGHGPEAPGRVRLRSDAAFPLRYRDLAGDYFRAIAETE